MFLSPCIFISYKITIGNIFFKGIKLNSTFPFKKKIKTPVLFQEDEIYAVIITGIYLQNINKGEHEALTMSKNNVLHSHFFHCPNTQ